MLLAFLLFAAAQTQAIGRTLLATVLSDRNRPIVDVEVDDFVVREAGQPQDVLSARVADYPVVILLDNSAASAQQDLDAIRVAAVRFVTRIGERPVAVCTVGPSPMVVASFAEDRQTVVDRIKGVAVQSGQAQVIQGIANAASLVR